MRLCGLIMATTALGLATGLMAAAPAHAQSPALMLASSQSSAPLLGRGRTPSVTLGEAADAQAANSQAANGSGAAAPRRALRWNQSGRWGLNFNLTEPVGRDADWGDVEAGAYYRLSPSLRVGAAAGLADPQPDPARAVQTERRAQPRVRLETIFKF